MAAAALVLSAGLSVAVQVTGATPAWAASSHATAIDAGATHTCQIQAGLAYCWGSNSNGQLGNGSAISSSTPVPVSTAGVLAGKTLTQITAGTSFTCALDSNGAAYCWGLGTSGQLGNNGVVSSSVPVAVTTSGVLSGKTLTAISAGTSSVCALASTGAAYCWGAGGSGQLGNNTTTAAQSTPVAVTTSGVLSGKTLTQITAGGASACALSSAGLAYCWGADNNGQLGDNSTTQSSVPVAVVTTGVLSGKTLAQIAGGGSHTCAIDTAGAAYCWGSDSNGQLGDSSTSQSQVPVTVTASGVLSGKTLVEITAQTTTTCALDSTGAAYCWGFGTSGQLGNNTTTSSQTTPVAVTATGVLSGKTLSQISATSSGSQVCALDSSGGAYCWGLNSSGQLGNPVTGVNFSVPVAVTAESLAVTTGSTHACALSVGRAYCWGSNASGQLGNGTTSAAAQSTPVAVSRSGVLSGKTLIEIAAGNGFTCALDTTGAAYCWGAGGSGQLGNGTTTAAQTTPVAVTTSGVLSGKTLADIAVGGATACALDTNGNAYCWGAGGSGQLGNNNTTATQSTPVSVASSGTLVQITSNASGSSTCALNATGAASCWGAGGSGQLGNGTTTAAQTTPTPVTTSGVLSGKVLTQVAAGGSHNCALDTAGLSYCWGAGGSGQLGNGSTTAAQTTAVTVTTSGVLSGKVLIQLTGGGTSTCAIDTAGLSYCWGAGGSGQLGNGSTTAAQTTAVTVTTSGVLSGKALAQIAGGGAFTCALDEGNAAYCWGLDSSGQLGNNGTTQSNVAVFVAPQAPTGVAAVPGDTTATVSWTAPVFLNGGTITGYAASAAPGGALCTTTTATSCTITGLTDGTTYTITVTVTATTGTASSTTVTVQPVGVLSMTVPATAVLPSAAPGGTATAQLGTVTVTDNRALASASWAAIVSATAFKTGAGTAPLTIAANQVTYWSGPATATTGTGTFVPGQLTAGNAAALGTTQPAFHMVSGVGVNSASWNPTLSVQVPASAVAGTYTATITHSVS